MFVCVQKPSSEWEYVESSTTGPAGYAAERLHLPKTRDVPSGKTLQQYWEDLCWQGASSIHSDFNWDSNFS